MTGVLSPSVLVPLGTIFGIQSALTVAAYAFPVVIPVAAADPVSYTHLTLPTT